MTRVFAMFIGLTRHSHTYAAQAQDGYKEEGAENSASHLVIKLLLWGPGKWELGSTATDLPMPAARIYWTT